MRVLCSFPGRAGDLIWALPAVRAISEHYQTSVDLLIAGEFAGMVPLLQQQPYLDGVLTDANWSLTPPNEWCPPWHPTEGYDRIYHLGYRGWPAKPLPFETQDTLATVWHLEDGPIPLIDLDRPWITADPVEHASLGITVGWTDCHFELKVGLMTLLERHDWVLLPAPGSRWVTEQLYASADWLSAARCIGESQVFLGDCSALHVLAVALGKPVVIYEPMEARWNPLFYPLGMDGRVRVVKGHDGLPTIDARHTADVLKEVLGHAR